MELLFHPFCFVLFSCFSDLPVELLLLLCVVVLLGLVALFYECKCGVCDPWLFGLFGGGGYVGFQTV